MNVLAQLQALREELNTALDAVRDNNPGLQLKVGNATYTADGSFTFKLEGAVPGGKNKEEGNYELLARYNDKLPKLGETVRLSGALYKVVGGVLRAKYNVVVQNVTTGKKVRYPADVVANAHQVAKAAA